MKHALSLAVASLRARPAYAMLTTFSVATALALLCALMLLTQNIQAGIQKNSGGVDVIVGAKGSKLQLTLSSLYHLDIPNGNIEASALDKIKKNAQVKTAIPLAMGDSYKGWRVIGTSSEYLDLYKAEVASGRTFRMPFEVVAGSRTGLGVGEKFAAVHGFSAEGDDVHDFHLYEVVGTLKPTGTAIDRLLITPIESVQQLHAHHEEHHEAEHHHDDEEEAAEEAMAHQITAILIKVKSPSAVYNLPREINRGEDVMAANPAYEMTRLSSGIGIGKKAFLAISIIVLALSVFMLFSTIASGMAGRQYDLAVLRVLGASSCTLFTTVIFEGALIGLGGTIIGIALGHGLAYGLTINIDFMQGLVLPQNLLTLGQSDAILLLTGIGAGIIAALLPAIRASRLDISMLLANKI